MPSKPFSEMRGIDSHLREAITDSLGGREPDSFVESMMGGAVDGPPLTPEQELDELRMIGELDEAIEAEIALVESEGF